MGGASCKHERTQVADEFTENLFWKRQVVVEKCLDCPETLKKKRKIYR